MQEDGAERSKVTAEYEPLPREEEEEEDEMEEGKEEGRRKRRKSNSDGDRIGTDFVKRNIEVCMCGMCDFIFSP